MRVLLIRHAQSLGQEPDADLSAEGHEQAHALIPRLGVLGVREVFSSPYRRAAATVGPFARREGLTVEIIDDLRERKLAPNWTPDFMVHMERSFADEHYCLKGGESLWNTAMRGLRGVAAVANMARTANPAVASHGNLIASVLRTIDPSFGFDAWRAMRNPHLFELEWENGRPVSFRDLDAKR